MLKLQHIPGLGRYAEMKPEFTTIVLGYTDYGGVIMRDVPTEVAEQMNNK